MSLRSALAGAATTAVLVGVLGSPGATDAARDADDQALATTLTALPGWDVGDQPGDVVGGVALRLGVLLVVVAVLCALAGRSGSRVAAFLGGWAALVVAGGAAGGAFYVYQVAVVLDGRTLAATYLDGLVNGANAGASFGLWTGWLVGLVVAAATARVDATAAAWDGGGRWEPAPVAAEPPPPWWASTATPDLEPGPIRPGPSVFLPGEVGAPAARGPAGPDLTQAMPAPFPAAVDPDATWLAGPRPDDDATVSVPVAGMPAAVRGDAEAGLPDVTLATGPGDPPPPDQPDLGATAPHPGPDLPVAGVPTGDADDPDVTAPDATATDEQADPDATATDEQADPGATAAPGAQDRTAPIPRPEA